MEQKLKEIIEQQPNFDITLSMKSGNKIILQSDSHKLNFDESASFLSVSGTDNYIILYDCIESIKFTV